MGCTQASGINKTITQAATNKGNQIESLKLSRNFNSECSTGLRSSSTIDSQTKIRLKYNIPKLNMDLVYQRQQQMQQLYHQQIQAQQHQNKEPQLQQPQQKFSNINIAPQTSVNSPIIPQKSLKPPGLAIPEIPNYIQIKEYKSGSSQISTWSEQADVNQELLEVKYFPFLLRRCRKDELYEKYQIALQCTGITKFRDQLINPKECQFYKQNGEENVWYSEFESFMLCDKCAMKLAGPVTRGTLQKYWNLVEIKKHYWPSVNLQSHSTTQHKKIAETTYQSHSVSHFEQWQHSMESLSPEIKAKNVNVRSSAINTDKLIEEELMLQDQEEEL